MRRKQNRLAEETMNKRGKRRYKERKKRNKTRHAEKEEIL
jgi:hypothetical protein